MARVLFVTHLPDWGGAQKCLYLLLQGLSREKYDPVVLAPREGPAIAAIRELGIPVRCAPMAWWLVGEQNARVVLRRFADSLEERVGGIAQILREEKIDLVFSNTLAMADAALAARRCGIPHVWHILEMLSKDPGLFVAGRMESLYNLVFWLSDRVVAVSDAVRQELEQFGPRPRVEVIHTGLPRAFPRPTADRQKLLGIPPEVPLVLFTGSICERKGVLDLVEAAELVLRRHPEVHFALIGSDGGRTGEIRRRIHRYRREGSIHLFDHRQDVPDLLSVADVFVLPSQADPLPVSVLEAMDAGLPVVATRSGGCEDMVLEGETGYLVDVGQPQALADRILSLLDHPERRAEMGQKAIQRFQQLFGHPRYIEQFETLLDDILSEKHPLSSTSCDETFRCIQGLLHDVADRDAAERQTRAELVAVKGSLLWRLRERLLAISGLRQLAKHVRRRMET